MAGTDRPRRVRAFARELQSRYDGRFEVTYDDGPTWLLQWTDGPSGPTIRQLAEKADLAGAKLRHSRSRSTAAIVLTAVRMAQEGLLGRGDGGSYRSGPLSLVESEVDSTDFPQRPRDDLHAALAERLLAIATGTSTAAWEQYRSRPRQGFSFDDVPLGAEAEAALMLRDQGLGWLIGEAAQAGTSLPPLLVLSARYAPQAGREHATAWRDRAQPLPLRTAVAAAIADEHLTEPAATALLALLPELRAELEQTEAAAGEAARRAGVPAQRVDAALDRRQTTDGGR